MKISVPIKNGFLPDEYSKHASNELKTAGCPNQSFPIHIEDLPQGTKTFAWTFVDFDAVSECGFVWIHWLGANLPASITDLPANASRQSNDMFIQGRNSNASPMANADPSVAKGYIGPQPPATIHHYTLTVYALDSELDLKDGFWLNELLHASEGHVLAKAKCDVPCRP
ncbi:YbhB/YbcL family Raf kinase inhibitor-like protein [Limosilactobacillus mucosae]|uniref:YbhB/YbcL family Raf kinase inhibitor-like protein n=1 Tax=Limosilactobacillus mucosae TaxID=97478 RepID=A0AAJ1M9K6_LIMMU|nr:YbhB/YbcL family Raf kinase inhibitor-like protein [Limosilactobacillus mucosae]MDC2828074.1 YbhB/YbcL family Raf kinase inhibitor-like protein [Limosilactobacillus mucosae]MDC2835739.1 YbhB/YbcL family Raf kinase inhibitor-like protein [Limosilactobacillus mucosae]MDC2840055.1 YbhB/YbcL family Raf kinase inhibitor-like protein [Limosilactobacillus mucosae]MDC2841402.1 YbhB/YbcL family Raf kinase inhibitor-like protein [Limosilactobacillus mucosae]MDC2842477.1 YbhB/YbcL family Raf kinase in